MILIIGGRAAGKRSYALERFGPDALFVHDLQAVVRQLLKEGQDPAAFVQQLIRESPDAVVLCDEVGMGIVPLDAFDRAWREAVGRACCKLASAADEVVRVVCGLPQRLK